MQNLLGSSVVHVYATRSGKCLKMAHDIWYRLVLSAKTDGLVATATEVDLSNESFVGPEEQVFSAGVVDAESDSGRAMSVLELDDEDDDDDVVDEDEEQVVKPFSCCRCFSHSGLLKNSPM